LTFAVLAALVSAGSLRGLDDHAAQSWMPGRITSDSGSKANIWSALIPFLHFHAETKDTVDVVEHIVTLPGYVLVAGAIIAICCSVLWRHGERRAAVAWGAAFVVGNVVEIVCKSIVVRPAVFAAGHVHLVAYDSSYPSGHALRAFLVAALLARLYPRLRPLLLVWLAAVAVLLVAAGAHTPSDVVGGLLLGGFLVAVVALVELEPRPRLV
jgi:membrane-associated phospholipid phosphatase